MSTTFPPHPLSPPSLPPSLPSRAGSGMPGAGGQRGDGQVPRGALRRSGAAPEGLPRPGPAPGPAAPGSSPQPGPGPERIRSRAAGFRNSPPPWKCLCILLRLPARCLTRYSPAGVTSWLCL